ncbi:hypothetical protein SCA6_003275 [Theobroma cacao]
MSRGSAAGPKGKKKGVTFTIDCSKPVEDKIMEIASLEKFKVGGKAAALGETVTLTREKSKIIVTADGAFSKSKDQAVYELRYFNIAENEGEEED